MFIFYHCHLPALLQHIDDDITTNIWTNKFNIWTIIFNATSLLYCNISTVISPQGAETFRRKKSRCAKNSGWRKRHRGSWSVQSCSHHKITKYQWNWSPKIFKAENIKTTKTNQTNKQLDPLTPQTFLTEVPWQKATMALDQRCLSGKAPASGNGQGGNGQHHCSLQTGN